MKIFPLVFILTLFAISSHAQVSMKAGNVPKKAEKLFGEAIPHWQEGDYDGTIELLTNALKSAPDFLDALKIIGDCYLVEGKLSDATNYYQQVVALDPDFSPPLYLKLGNSLFY